MTGHLYESKTTPLYGVTEGEGDLIICMHGITANAHVFEPVMKMLRDQFQLVSIDQRGHGRSGRPQDYAGADFASDVAALVSYLDCGPAILLGHSLGARNALITANMYPEHVRAVVAVEFTPFIESEVFTQLEARVAGGNRSFPDLDAVRAYLSDRYPLLPPDAIQRRAEFGYRKTDDGYRPLADDGAMVLTAAGLRENIEEAVAKISAPTILVRGAISKLVSKAAWAKTLELRPDLEAVEISDADHYVHEIQPAAVAGLVRRFS